MRLPTPGTTGVLALVLVTGAGPAAALAGGPPERTPPATVASPEPRLEEEISRHVAASRPGPEHRWLDPLEGSWNVTITWQSAGRAPTRLTGTSENHWILGGRFLRCEGAIGEEPSQIEQATIYGFDSQQQKFFALGLNNLGTHYLQPWGTYDPATRSFILSGKERDEVTGAILVYRELLKVESPDRHILTLFFDLPGRGPVKVIEATYARR
jgi:hypothetical protein